MNTPVPQIKDNSDILKTYRNDFEESLKINNLTEDQVENGFKAILFNEKINSDEGIEKVANYINSLQESLGDDPFPVYHKFGGGMYTREIHMPKGYAVVGKKHKHDSMVYMLKGKAIVADRTGTKVVEAPAQFVSDGGIKRVGYIIEDIVWIDIHTVKSTNIKEAEKEIFEVESYKEMIESLGYTEKEVRCISENEKDIIDIANNRIEVKKSNIEGNGIFAAKDINEGKVIGIARLGSDRTNIGKYTNHSFCPNAKCYTQGSVISFISIKNIKKNEEITVDYRDSVNSANKLDNMLNKTIGNGALCQV